MIINLSRMNKSDLQWMQTHLEKKLSVAFRTGTPCFIVLHSYRVLFTNGSYWPPCLEQVLLVPFLCHILVILTKFHSFCSLLYFLW